MPNSRLFSISACVITKFINAKWNLINFVFAMTFQLTFPLLLLYCSRYFFTDDISAQNGKQKLASIVVNPVQFRTERIFFFHSNWVCQCVLKWHKQSQEAKKEPNESVIHSSHFIVHFSLHFPFSLFLIQPSNRIQLCDICDFMSSIYFEINLHTFFRFKKSERARGWV